MEFLVATVRLFFCALNMVSITFQISFAFINHYHQCDQGSPWSAWCCRCSLTTSSATSPAPPPATRQEFIFTMILLMMNTVHWTALCPHFKLKFPHIVYDCARRCRASWSAANLGAVAAPSSAGSNPSILSNPEQAQILQSLAILSRLKSFNP